MSFFSRISNLVNGFAHSFLDSVEQNNPHMMQEQRIIEQRKQYQKLKEAAGHYQQLVKSLEVEMEIASEEERPALEAERDRIVREKEKTLAEIEALKEQITELKMGIPDVLANSESTAEEQLNTIRDHIDRKAVESKLFQTAQGDDSLKTERDSSPNTQTESEPVEAQKPKKRKKTL